MIISLLTLFPELYTPFLSTSLIRRAQEADKVTFDVANMLSFCKPKERIDGPTFGHGAGMVLRPEVVERAVEAQEQVHGKAFKIFFSPQGRRLNQDLLKELIEKLKNSQHLMLLAARYEGMDSRVEDHYADETVSLGDFVIMGGDLPAMVLLEGLLRLIPGIVGKQESVEQDSFWGPLVDHPEYTAPVVWQGLEVPEVIRSGNHGAIKEWQEQVAVEKTVYEHFDWLRSHQATEKQQELIVATLPSHYVVLMHSEVLLPQGIEGTTSVTSLDIHDIARSAKTYGLKGYFIVTPLKDQQRIVQKLLDFWQEGVGVTYNPHRHEALRQVIICDRLEDVCQKIAEIEGADPLVVTTSAKVVAHPKTITYYDQKKVWAARRPVLLVFGTGHGLAESVTTRADFNLLPIIGYSHFNHLSVRSAVAIIFDRWLGINLRSVEENKP